MSVLIPDTVLCPPKFEAVRQAFIANFEGELAELGARFCAAIDGEIVLDLWGGHADRARTRPFDDKTLTPVFSSSKAAAALMCALAVGRGALDYGRPAAALWPEFAAQGKGALTVEQVLSHQAGLSGLREAFDPDGWFDWDGMCARLAAAEPLWPPASASGYHPSTFGHLAGELFRRADGRTLGQALRADLCEPFGLELWIGLPEGEDHRVAETVRPPTLPELGKLTEPRILAFFKPWSAAPAKDIRKWRGAELPASNGHATAAALARMMAVLACDGELDGREVLPPGLALEAARARIAGDDQVLPFNLSWGAGFLRNAGLGVYGPSAHSFGHSGWGGSCAVADPERRLSLAYVMNRQSAHLIGDPRARRLIDALYACL
ncbi:MAG TPA: serine hydrolase domain-containing protein [Caulobacteraceae bacterium]|nr:serine hydrolase domain-containing protein [Caulobacteraceae bacterium]